MHIFPTQGNTFEKSLIFFHVQGRVCNAHEQSARVNVAQQYKIGKSKKLKNSSKGAVLFTRLEQTLEKINF